ncbi:MAG TPA: MgtC/SapB family protein [Acidobacteriota bacterium]|nr:MgtC/SapB family protein [Acidobacteriota bacterium]
MFHTILTNTDIISVVVRIFAVLATSLFFGIQRQKEHKPIGFGTYTFVATGSCALTVAASIVAPDAPLTIVGSIVTGIGFLGAGALMKQQDKTFGFTTAAAIWAFAIFGVVVGLHQYLIGAVIYAIIWIIILIDGYLERHGIGSYRKKLTIKTNQIVNEKEVRTTLLEDASKCHLISIHVDKKENRLSIVYQIQGTKESINKIPNKLYHTEWFESCMIE